MSEDFKYPQVMNANQENNSLWLHMDTKEIQQNQVANPNMPIPTAAGPWKFTFLMPDSFSTALSHSWEPYDSIAARLAETISRWYKGVTQIKGIASAVTGAKYSYPSLKDAITKAFSFGTTWNEQIVNTRIDSPLVYKNSQPLQYNINFTFIAHSAGDSSLLYEMTRLLMKSSCPTRPGGTDNIYIEPPMLFRIYTTMGSGTSSVVNQIFPVYSAFPMINLQYAALVAVQPTFYGPYVQHGPLKLELQLTFQDITPLFSNTFDATGTSVTTAPGA